MKNDLDSMLKDAKKKFDIDLTGVEQSIQNEKQKPLTAAIFGQTGTGKSSLTNAIFGTNFEVDDVKPCTKEPQVHQGKDNTGHPVIFWDLPGIGESSEADDKYLKMYAEIASSCDVILWAFQADTRSTIVDSLALEHIIQQLDKDEVQQFLNRIAVVVTKADTINFDSWIYAKDKSSTVVACGDKTSHILSEKSKYFYEALLGKHKDIIINRTYISSNNHKKTDISDDLWLDEEMKFIHFKGVMNKSKVDDLLKRHPKYIDEIKRLQDSSKGVCCSSRLKFNLNEVKSKIVQKSSGASVLRLSQSLVRKQTRIDWNQVKNLGFPIIYDMKTNKILFDVNNF